MPQTPHIERHFAAGAVVRDVVIGMSDGLTVPFALAAGLSGAVDNSHIVVVAGLAEIAAGSIAMGLGGYLAARSDAEHYESERLREEREVQEIPAEEALEVQKVFADYGRNLYAQRSIPRRGTIGLIWFQQGHGRLVYTGLPLPVGSWAEGEQLKLDRRSDGGLGNLALEIGRASCRER